MYKKIRGPYLELQFYFSDGNSNSPYFFQFVNTLLQAGSTLAGAAQIIHLDKREDLPPELFTHRGKAYDSEYLSFSPNEWEEISQLKKNFFQTFYMYNLTGIYSSRIAERVKLLPFPSKYESTETHPVSIMTEYNPFNLTSDFPNTEGVDSQIAGDVVYKRFIEIAELTQPTYAIITAFEDIPVLSEIKDTGQSSSTFNTLYVNKSLEITNELKSIHKGAYTLDLTHGIYFTSSPFFNSENRRWNWRKDYPDRLTDLIDVLSNV